jgi:hypothetical protein
MWQHLISLPLEIRNMIYDHVLSEPHDILTNGIPSLYKVHPAMTSELYTYRKTITTVSITHRSVYPCHEDAGTPPPLLQTRLLALVRRFEENKEMAKGIVVVFKAVHHETNPNPIPKNRDGDPLSAILGRVRAASRSIDVVFTESKAVFWSVEFRYQGVETRVDRSDNRTGSGVFC